MFLRTLVNMKETYKEAYLYVRQRFDNYHRATRKCTFEPKINLKS